MKTFVKETKTKTYINFNGNLYVTDHNWSSFDFQSVNFSTMQEQQVLAIRSEYGWREIGEFETIHDAYLAYIDVLKKEKEARKRDNGELQARIDRERQEAWERLAILEEIPATISNLRTLLLHLNEQNWGAWELPRLSIGYSANQYDCDGIIATTIRLDNPISDEELGINNERMFKVGGKRGHLEQYQRL
jgi:hypothetical protein